MISFLDTVAYTFLSFAHIWTLLATLMLFFKRRRFRALPWSRERRFYHAVIAISVIAWVWNGLRPTPALFEERVGLYWGSSWKTPAGGSTRAGCGASRRSHTAAGRRWPCSFRKPRAG